MAYCKGAKIGIFWNSLTRKNIATKMNWVVWRLKCKWFWFEILRNLLNWSLSQIIFCFMLCSALEPFECFIENDNVNFCGMSDLTNDGGMIIAFILPSKAYLSPRLLFSLSASFTTGRREIVSGLMPHLRKICYLWIGKLR